MASPAPFTGDVFRASAPNRPVVRDADLEQSLYAIATSFMRIKPLIDAHVCDESVRLIAIVENSRRTVGAFDDFATCHTVDNGATTDISHAHAVHFVPCEDLRDAQTEQKILKLLGASQCSDLPSTIIYRRMANMTEQVIVALAFRADSPYLQARKTDQREQFTIQSFADCIVHTILLYCSSPRQAETLMGLASDVLAGAACQLLLQTISRSATGRSNEAVFGLCCDIASAQYEGRAGSGLFIFYDRDDAEDIATIRFDSPVHVSHNVGVRKLIEMASDNFALLFDGDYFWGFSNHEKASQLSHVGFKGRGLWSVRAGDEIDCLVSYGVPVPTHRILTEHAFKSHLHCVFPGISEAGVAEIWAIAQLASEQPVGTNILFTPKAAEEARRLSSQCICIEPIKMDSRLTLQLTAIDGTVITDTEGYVHALGAIMDGRSTINGTWQRGGRYNSAANYVSSAEHPALIFIVSQDGYVDIVPPIEREGQKWKQSRYLKLSSTAIS